MPWKWDPTRPHNVAIRVSPANVDESEVGIVWGDLRPETKTVQNNDAGKLIRELAKQVQALGYALEP